MTGIRKDVLTFMPLNCTWAQELMENVQKTCLSKVPLKGWIPMKIHIVDNPDLEEAFEDRKEALRKMGRTEEELKEQYCFMAESWRAVVSMCKYGVRCHEKKTNILGDTRDGLHLNKHYDMLLKFMTFRNFITARCVVVFKVVPGRVKRVIPRFKGRTALPPSKHYDAHVSVIDPDPNISVCEGLANNFIYVYQLDPETMAPLPYPRQAVPYAVIQLRQPYRLTVSRPFASFRERFMAQMRQKEAVNGHRSISRRPTLSDRKDSKDRSPYKSTHQKRSTDTSEDSDDCSRKKRERDKMPKLTPEPKQSSTPLRKRSSTPVRKGSSTPVRKRSSTPVRKRSSTPASMTSDKDQSVLVVEDIGTDKTCIKTKLQKIEEEIKLRQSKLTELRHMKNTQESEKLNESGKDKTSSNVCQDQSSEYIINASKTKDEGETFAPRISCVFSTSNFDDFEDSSLVRYRELSSGASTPTLDEPGDHLSNYSAQLNHTDDKCSVSNNETGETEMVSAKINMLDDNETERLDEISNMNEKSETDAQINCSNTNTETCLQRTEISVKSDIKTENMSEDKKPEEASKTSNNDAKKTDEGNKTDLNEPKIKTEQVDKHVTSENVDTEALESCTAGKVLPEKLSDNNVDINTLIREAIYKMDPSDLYELLTEKMNDGEDDELDSTGNNIQTEYSKNVCENEHVEDGMILDLSCKRNIVDHNYTAKPCDENNKNKPPNTPQETISTVEGIESINDKNNISNEANATDFMLLDNLAILASVASELQAAKSRETESSGNRNLTIKTEATDKILSSVSLQLDNLSSKHCISNVKAKTYQVDKIGLLNIKPEQDGNDETEEEQEYIFDAEDFNPKYTESVSLQTGKQNKPLAFHAFKSTDVEESAQNDAPSAMNSKKANKRKMSEKKKDCSVDTTDQSNQSAPIIASTKRRTANSIAAAIAATEKSPTQLKSVSPKVPKQSQKRKQHELSQNAEKTITTTEYKENDNRKESMTSQKIKDVPTAQTLSHDSSEKHTVQSVTTKYSPKITNNTKTSEQQFNCRENLFEKFASADPLGKESDNENANDKVSSSNDLNSTQNSITSKGVTHDSITIKQELDSELYLPESSSVKSCSQSVDPTGFKQQSISMPGGEPIDNIIIKQEPNENISSHISSSVESNCQTSQNISTEDKLKTGTSSLHIPTALSADQHMESISIKQEPNNEELFTPMSSLSSFSPTKNIKKQESCPQTSTCIKATNHENADNLLVETSTKSSCPSIKSTNQMSYNTSIKQEPIDSDLLRITTSSKTFKKIINQKRSMCRSQSSDGVKISATADLNESVVELMNQKVTESMNQSDLSFNSLSVIVKKEPITKDEITETKSDADIFLKSIHKGKTSNQTGISTQYLVNGKRNDENFKQVPIPVIVKKEPMSPSMDSSPQMPTLDSISETIPEHLTQKSNRNPKDEVGNKDTIETKESSSIPDLNKTLMDLEQVIGIFSQKVNKNSNDIPGDKTISNTAISNTKARKEDSVKQTLLDTDTCVSSGEGTERKENKKNENLFDINIGDKDSKTIRTDNKRHEPTTKYMPIEVITGNIPPRKNATTSKVPRSVTASSSISSRGGSHKIDTSGTSHVRSINILNSETTRLKNNNGQSDEKCFKSTGKNDDKTRVTRVLNEAFKESNTSEKTRDIAVKIKAEPLTDDELYGVSSAIPKSSKIQSKRSPQKQKVKASMQTLKTSNKRKVSESTQSSSSPSRQDRMKGSVKRPRSSKSSKLSSKKDNTKAKEGEYSKTPGLNPLEAIRTQYSSSKYDSKNRHYSKREESSVKMDRSRPRLRSRSSSFESSCSTSTSDSPNRAFMKRDRNSSFRKKKGYLDGDRSPVKYKTSDDRTWYVKSKWDNNDTPSESKSGHRYNTYIPVSSPGHKQVYNSGLSSVSSVRNSKSSSSFSKTFGSLNHSKPYTGGKIIRQKTFYSPSDYFCNASTCSSEPVDSHSGRNKTLHVNSTANTAQSNRIQSYNNDIFGQVKIKRERSSSYEKDVTDYSRKRSLSNEQRKSYERKRRSDSGDRKLYSDLKRRKSSSYDRDGRAYFRQSRIRSRSRDRESSSSSDRSRRTISPKLRTGLLRQADDKRFDFYRSSPPQTTTPLSLERNHRERTSNSSMERNHRERTSNSSVEKNHRERTSNSSMEKNHRERTSYSSMERNQRERTSNSLMERNHIERTSNNKDDTEINSTLSKAMSTLLKKIIFDDKVQDNSKEGRMADMVLDMVKARVSAEQNKKSPQTRSSSPEFNRTFDAFSTEKQVSSHSSGFDSLNNTRFSVIKRNREDHDSSECRSSYGDSNRTSYSSSYSDKKHKSTFDKTRLGETYKSQPWSSTAGRGFSSTRPWSSTRPSFHRNTSRLTGHRRPSRDKHSDRDSNSRKDHRSSSK